MRRLSLQSRGDLLAIAGLILLWLLFFWRLFTPSAADQASLKQGDFSGQFVAFAGYQYQRFTAGEVPLWNPYNNGGFPFIGDPQAAVFYPLRLLTIGLAHASGGWSYHALELEMTAHVLLYTLLMYVFVRRLTLGAHSSMAAGFTAAVVGGYGGYLTGYPPLQLALLEAGIWLPLAALGLLETFRHAQPRWRWLLVTGAALGLSWLAGHPQTSYFLTLLLIAYSAYLVIMRRLHWTAFFMTVVGFGGLAFGLASVQLIPGLEYLPRTARADMGFDAKGNGFPFQDVIQFVYPGILTLWSPLYVGIGGLALALIAVWRRAPQSAFWAAAALFALVWSFGANAPLYPILYHLLPGLSYFRGQERAAYLVANSMAILAGLGVVALRHTADQRDSAASRGLQRWLILSTGAALLIAALLFTGWLSDHAAFGVALYRATFTMLMLLALLAATMCALIPRHTRWAIWLLPALIAFDLFTLGMNAESNYDPIPPSQQLSMVPPPLVALALADENTPFFVDGFRGLTDNYGSLYRLADIRGISPLFLRTMHALIEGEIPIERTWELMAVRYVFTDWGELPVPSQIIGTGIDRWGGVHLHQLDDPRPFALVTSSVFQLDDPSDAIHFLRSENIDLRRTVLLSEPTTLTFEQDAVMPATAHVRIFEPERILIDAAASGNSVLSIALPHYPGWQAFRNGEPVQLMNAYGALTAVELPAGDHVIELRYDPLSYRIGLMISLLTVAVSGILAVILFQGRSETNAKQRN
ncbi:MAG: YfhO family protein [Aggregatilineales bacterium]